MNFRQHWQRSRTGIKIISLLVAGLFSLILAQTGARLVLAQADNTTILTIYDQATREEMVLVTTKPTLKEAIEQADLDLSANDKIEPALDTGLVANHYQVNIFRSRPIVVIDGQMRVKILSTHQTPDKIAKAAGLEWFPEDRASLKFDFTGLADDWGIQMTIQRAKKINLILFGEKTEIRTHFDTVGDFLADKDIRLDSKTRANHPEATKITNNMSLEVWKEGGQELTVTEPVDFEVRIIQDRDQKVGYRKIKTPGVKGEAIVTYEVLIKNGQEVERKKLKSVTTKEPQSQEEIVGVKSTGGLTKSKGVNTFIDSRGVSHRETYYDLPMRVVMGNCGAGGYYTVREDGVKVDRDGYVIIAANLKNYPRCSVVETSLGAGKVYDTGGFAAVHPHGFDIATDWTRGDGI